MTSFANRISQKLHEEHCANVALMERLEQFIACHRRDGLPNINDNRVARLLSDLSAGMEAEVQRHFDFEENRLFTHLNAIGEEAISAHLTDEHAVMRPIASRVAGLARHAATNGFDETRWQEFCRSGQDLCERLLAHINKEETALLPLIEVSMDTETETRLLEEYLETA